MKFLLFILISSISYASEVRPFATDYCTLYPEGTKDEPSLWKHCCITHDLFMWAGGTKEERLAVDLELKNCVAETGQIDHANRIFIGVRLGSLSPIKFEDKAWGNAWTNRPRAEKLSEEQIVILTDAIEDHPEITAEIYQQFRSTLFGRLD